MNTPHPLTDCLRSTRGAAAVEFALVAPVLAVLLMGIAAYGGYFWTAHAVQQIANDAARAAMAGVDAKERARLIAAAVTQEAQDYAVLDPGKAAVSVTDLADRYAVRVTYDASESVFFSLGALAPMPSAQIVRQATVRTGGY
jgi:Flp pilus assembly protein TadG